MQEPIETNECPRCANEHTTDTKYCGNCGFSFASPTAVAPLGDLRSHRALTAHRPKTLPSRPSGLELSAVDCPRCNHTTEPGAIFCFNCGLPFDRATGSRQSPPIGAIPAYIGVRPSGFWIRFVAFIIDSIITTAAVSVLTSMFTDVSPSDYMQGLDSSDGADFINWAFNLGYAPILLGIWATTVGKRSVNMYVLKLDGSPVGFWRALGREMAKVISAVPLFAGFWMVALRSDKRSLHDIISGTVVVQR